jgi:hypothetical protein
MVSIPTPSGLVQSLITRCIAGATAAHPTWVPVAKERSLLPIFADFMGYWLLTPEGQLMFLPHEEPRDIFPVVERPQERLSVHAVFASAARTYPALAPYCPQRTPDSPPCTSCKGTGKLVGVPDNVMCACGGTGWVPAGLLE